MTITPDAEKLQQDLNQLAVWENKWLMRFRPEKCNVLSITRNRRVIKKNYILHGHQLEHIPSAKYLGVTISSDLKWTQHINNIAAKANSTIGFLKRNINISNGNIKEKAYKTLRRAARYVHNRYHNTSSVTEMLDQLEWPSLEERQRIASLSVMYKLVNNKVQIDTKVDNRQLLPFQIILEEESLPTDCKDLRDNSYTKTGVYDIYPFGTSSHPVRVDCDMDTMDGGWTAIQKRIDGSVSFNRNWAEYKNGFGSPEQDVWIGNDIIHQLTKGKNSYLYVSITLVNGTKMYQLYDGFSVSDEAEKYKLFLMGSIKGTLGDSMVDTDFYGILSGMYFSTLDKDNDVFYGGLGNDNSGTSDNCALLLGGGWWFNACHQAFLNGPWSSPDWEQVWSPVIRYGTQVRGTMMLIKRH
ncbi:fibroleukin-like [Saccostrea echinata]|uniref:fibroleukin-like n=1 Tax=Saccostrea echinata TaxID=191078 RepID=UPI002A7FAEF8|nr:fibroleukin-like [Saccostrea echinata]